MSHIYVFGIVIVISKFLERYSAQGTSLFKSKGVDQRLVQGLLRSDFQRVRGDRVAVTVGVVLGEIVRMDDRMRIFSNDDTSPNTNPKRSS